MSEYLTDRGVRAVLNLKWDKAVKARESLIQTAQADWAESFPPDEKNNLPQ
jgi:hypothetical protein